MNVQKTLIVAAMSIGVAPRQHGLASAATGNSGTTAASTACRARPAAPSAQKPFGGQRSDESPHRRRAGESDRGREGEGLGGTIIRVETDADGHAKYEAHMTDANGTPSPCYVDGNYNVVTPRHADRRTEGAVEAAPQSTPTYRATC